MTKFRSVFDMKILVVSQYYYPEPFRISDICEELVNLGHEVEVLTGVPNYPEGEIYAGYKNRKRREEKVNGVNVHRCYTIPRRKSTIFRFLNYYSFVFSSVWRSFTIKSDFDVVFVNQLSPVMMSYAAIVYKKIHKKKMILYCLDLWPESLTIGGISRGSFVYKIFHGISSKIYKSADRILVSSKMFSDYFEKEFGITKTIYLPQYAEKIFSPDACFKKPNNKIDLMFAGNIGSAQSVETIIYAANITRRIDNLFWHIVGDGAELENMKSLTKSLELSNVIFHGRKSIEEMPMYYAMADAMLVTMTKNDLISTTLPGKIQTYMAAGKPIIGAIDGEASVVIRDTHCGVCCAAEDFEGLAELVMDFINNENRYKYAQASLEGYDRLFSKEKVITALIDNLSV